jgi:hypothetical protein
MFTWKEVCAGCHKVIAGNRNNGVGTSGWVDGKLAVVAYRGCFKCVVFSWKWMVWYPIGCRTYRIKCTEYAAVGLLMKIILLRGYKKPL